MRAASRSCVGIMNKFFVDEMSEIIDDEKKVSHAQLALKIEAKLDDNKFFKSKDLKLGADVSFFCSVRYSLSLTSSLV